MKIFRMFRAPKYPRLYMVSRDEERGARPAAERTHTAQDQRGPRGGLQEAWRAGSLEPGIYFLLPVA